MDSKRQGEIFSFYDRIKILYTESSWTDVSFAVSIDEKGSATQIVKAHKAILANASEVFEKMFFGSLPENTSRVIEIKCITADIFVAMLKYIYTDVVDLNDWQSWAQLYMAAERYMLYALSRYCVASLIKQLTPANVLEIYEFAVLSDQPALLNSTLTFIRNDTRKVFNSNFFEDMDLNTLMVIMEQNNLQTKEVELFYAVEMLAKHKGAIKSIERNTACDNVVNSDLWEFFRTAIKNIRFRSMTDKEFKDGAVFSSLLTADEAFSISVCLTKPCKIVKYYPEEFTRSIRKLSLPKLFFDIAADGNSIGRIVMELRADIAPYAAAQFRQFCIRSENSYRGQKISPICPHYCSGDVSSNEEPLLINDDEKKFKLKHTAGVLGMLVSVGEKKYSGSVFYFTFEYCPHFDERCLAIGRVIRGLDVLRQIKSYATEIGIPLREVRIQDCGEL